MYFRASVFLTAPDLVVKGFIYTATKVKAKATSLPTSYVVSNVCIYTAATARSKKKFAFTFAFAPI